MFAKRLRKKFVPVSPFEHGTVAHEEFIHKHGIRYFMCGEYGESFSRPHYHAILFNFDFPDKEFYKDTDTGHKLFTSPTLNKLWDKGSCWIGAVTFDSAAYVARYVTKKITGDMAETHYKAVHLQTGELIDVEPEYADMSRKPGIGKVWFDKYAADTYPSDEVIVNARAIKPPRYYDNLYGLLDEQSLEEIKKKRKELALQYADDNTQDRLLTKELVKLAQFKQLKRTLE